MLKTVGVNLSEGGPVYFWHEIETGGATHMGVYFFEKSLSFLSPALCVVFEILKFTQKFGSKLGFFPKKLKEFPRNEENE